MGASIKAMINRIAMMVMIWTNISYLQIIIAG